MTTSQKKQLYENIMKSVAKNLKKVLNEGVPSVVPLKDVLKAIEPIGWTYTHSSSGDGFKLTKGEHTIYGHLKHGHSKDMNRIVDVGGLDELRTCLILDFYKSNDPTQINSIDWKYWRLPNPFIRELVEYDPITGIKKEVKPVLNKGQQLNIQRKEKAIRDANNMYKDAALIKIDHNNPDSAYIIMAHTTTGTIKYNTCRSENDRRPLLKEWVTDFDNIDGNYYFGKINMRILKIKFHKVLSDGSLDKKVFRIDESFSFT